MSQPFTMTGGARVGWTNASWPLARLSADRDRLTISIRLLGTYSFVPEEVSAIERYVMIPVLGWGVRIRHCKADCPERVIFWCLGNPDTALKGIRKAGFLPGATSSSTVKDRGIVLRWSAIIAAVVVWNGLFLLQRAALNRGVLGALLLAPLVFALVVSIGTFKSPTLQRLVLKPGRDVGEIRPFLGLLAFISGFLLFIFSILLASGAFKYTSR